MKPHISVLLALLVVGVAIVSPVCAGNYTPRGNLDFWKTTTRDSFTGSSSYSYSAPDGDKINIIQFTVDTGQRVDFVLYYGGNKTVSGSAENSITSVGICGFLPCPMTTAIVTLGGASKSYSYGDIQPLFDFDIAGYGVDNDNGQTGFIVYDGNFGKYDNDLAVFYPVSNIGLNLISRIDINGSQTFSLWVDHGPTSDIAGLVGTGLVETINTWVDFALSLGGMVLGFVIGVWHWLYFFFVENLLMTVSLYLSITMAYSACTSRNIFRFFGKFFNDQRKLFEFIIGLWRGLIEIISSFRGIFRI
jgi:hypothetical protein